MVASVRLSVNALTPEPFSTASTGAEWSILVLGFAKYSKRSSETQVSYTLKNIIECSSQGAFKMIGQSKWLLFRKVAPSRSITLLMFLWSKLLYSNKSWYTIMDCVKSDGYRERLSQKRCYHKTPTMPCVLPELGNMPNQAQLFQMKPSTSKWKLKL